MDLIEYYKLQTLTQFISMQFLKKVTQLVLPVSVFSFFFSHSSSFSFPQSFDFLSAFPLQLFGHTIDKNCIFLLCNGLLVLLAKYSGLIRSLSGSYQTTEAMLENKVMVEIVGFAENVALRQRREIDYLIKDVKKEIEKTTVEEGGESRKFDDFIRRVKEEIRIEAQRQLVMV
ncbi:uncharacterized protein LOC118349443 [Juglans regia]|uniref:Uncharacterized protein LOC118349443 n=1 Tax=Juglans regia TaxID=51240 RepID=A0A6P9ER85_JUGRE|nr:uncharacterized protein LOC118349443 [Juglans regia]